MIILDCTIIISNGGTSMRRIVNFLKQKNVLGVLNCMALSVVVLNAQQCCYWFMHQPEFPTAADKFRKFK